MAVIDEYARPSGLQSALDLLAEGRWRILAGGTDIYPAHGTRGLKGPVLDITAIADIAGIERSRSGIRIGAGTTWSEIATAALPPAMAGLQQAAREVGGWQIQNAGTIGGNICNASPAADGMPPLLALAAEVEITSVRGQRRMPLAQFVTGPRRTDVAADEIVTALRVPASALDGRSRFIKFGARKYLVISIASVAVRLVEREGILADVALAVGACSGVPLRLGPVEAALTGLPIAEAVAGISAEDVATCLAPVDDIRASAAYRAEAAAELLRRAVGLVLGGAA